MSGAVRAALVFSALGLVALLAAAVVPRHGEAEEGHGLEGEGHIQDVVNIDTTWNMEEAVQRARAEELAKRNTAPRVDPVAELEKRMVQAIIQEQPYYKTRARSALRLARIIYDAAEEHTQSPWIALAMAYKESSLSPGVGELQVTGGLGEEGYFQIMPRSYPGRTCGKGRSMGNARANADTAMCYLAHVRDICGTDDPWQYVSAYGMRRCPRPGEGRGLRPSKRGRRILCRMVGQEECDRIWPPVSPRTVAVRARIVHPSPVTVAGLGDF
jgi:hypothetical protein